MPFTEVFTGPVPNESKQAYADYAKVMGALTLKAGALSVSALWGDELSIGPLQPLAGAVKVGDGETLVARIVRWPSKAAREEGWANMMKTPDNQAASIVVPFDRSRVCYAGFEEL